MKTQLLVLLLCFCATQFFFAQDDDGVVSLNLPVRNSLTFNRYAINPTFSFVREQNKYISIYNKREWVQFDDAPLTYLASYNGRFAENIGAGIGLFQQNYGVLSTFGAVLNFAYNARLTRDNNLTFGLNIGAYKSGINTGNVVTNFDDPSLQDVPENFLLTMNPGINFGLERFDFGVSVNNLVVYNLNTSTLLEDNPERGIQGHIMYTGYLNSRGFFNESKFSGLLRSEFKTDKTIVSALGMISVPKGIWAQAGYNTLYGISAGIGLNITPQIAIEYNIEKGTGAFTNFGNSYTHEVTLAYRFKNNETYDYSSGDEVNGLISTSPNSKPSKSKISKSQAEANRKIAAERKAQAQAQLLAEQKAKKEALVAAKLVADQKAKEEAEAQAKLLAEQKAKEEAEAQDKLLTEQKAKEDAEARAIMLAEQKAKEKAEAQAKLLAEQKAMAEAVAQAKLLAEEQAKLESEAQARLLEEQKAIEEAEKQTKLLEEQKAKEEAKAQAKLVAEQIAMAEAVAQAKLLAEEQAKLESEAQARRLEEQEAKEKAEAQAKLLEEQRAKEELITNPKDEFGKVMYELTQQAADSKTRQDELFKKIDDIVEIKNQDLKDLKEENDLNEKGITAEPKPFKSITEENNRLQSMIASLDNVIESRNQEIEELKKLYKDKYESEKAVDTVYLDEVYMFYNKTLDRLTAEQIEATQAKIKLQLELETIQIATEFERNRRIKRALYNNEEERYAIDRATLKNIKSTTSTGEVFAEEDFDFGEELSSNIQILKNIEHIDSGYYLVIAVHSDIQKRNDFVSKVVASGRKDVDFFYDVKTSKYFIYYDKFDSINAANEALKTKGNRPYNTKMSLMKIEN